MASCQFKRGFFILRRCDRPADKQCEGCGQPSCQYHLSAQSAMRLCVDCAQKDSQRQAGYYEDDWVYSYRHTYYGYGYRPFLYSQHDYRSFDRYDDDSADFTDDAGTGDFFDS